LARCHRGADRLSGEGEDAPDEFASPGPSTVRIYDRRTCRRRASESVVTRPVAATVVVRRGTVEVRSWPMAASWGADLVTVNLLARLQLEARRRGCTIGIRGIDPHLRDLLDLTGLARSRDNPTGIDVATDESPASAPS
jgi:STAS domain